MKKNKIAIVAGASMGIVSLLVGCVLACLYIVSWAELSLDTEENDALIPD